MAVLQDGTSGNVLASVSAPTDALSVNNKPYVSATLGSYRLGMVSGVMAAGLGAASDIYQFRYNGAAGSLCVVEKVVLDGAGSILAFAAGAAVFRMFVSRSMTALAAGGTSATMTGNNQKLRSSYATTSVAQVNISTTAALTSAVGDVPDAQAIGGVVGSFTAVAGAMIDESTLLDAYYIGHPLILAPNEGFFVQATVPATGTWTFGITTQWSEMTQAEWGS